MSYRDRIRDAEAALERARREQEQINREQWNARREAEQRVIESFAERRARATESASAAHWALAAVRIEWARSGERTPYPLGTKVRRWRWHYGTENYSEEKVTGVLEVVTEETQHPGGKSYERAAVGDLIVRLHKADGSPGLKYERIVPATESRLGKIWRPYK